MLFCLGNVVARDKRVASGGNFGAIVLATTVGVEQGRIGKVSVHFLEVGEGVAVSVGKERTCSVYIYLIPISQAIAIGVIKDWAGTVCIYFVEVGEGVAVGVG